MMGDPGSRGFLALLMQQQSSNATTNINTIVSEEEEAVADQHHDEIYDYHYQHPGLFHETIDNYYGDNDHEYDHVGYSFDRFSYVLEEINDELDDDGDDPGDEHNSNEEEYDISLAREWDEEKEEYEGEDSSTDSGSSINEDEQEGEEEMDHKLEEESEPPQIIGVEDIGVDDEPHWSELLFNELKHCKMFYTEFGIKEGFSVRIKGTNNINTRKEKTDRTYYLRMECSKGGYDKRSGDHPNNNGVEDAKPKQRYKASIKTGCKACMWFRYDDKLQKYQITNWDNNHNHAMHDPSVRDLMSTKRNMSELNKLLVAFCSKSGIKPKSAYELLCLIAGGATKVGFTELDHRNCLRTSRKRNMQRGEAAYLTDYFINEAARNPKFFYKMQYDVHDQIASIFWADAEMRMDYESFGDSISFDTTYRTNDHHRPLGMFVGFNNHRNCTIFGAALLYDETADTFRWLFQAFIECMGGKAPKSIFTDQAGAIALGLRSKMPNTFHGLCTWHIRENCKKNIPRKYLTKTFWDCWRMVTHLVDSEEGFEVHWNLLLKHNFKGRARASKGMRWLEKIKKKRHQWSSAWVRNNFTCGMKSSQLSESCNSSLQEYNKPHSDISLFFDRFTVMVRDRREKERKENFKAVDRRPSTHYDASFLMRSVRDLYTPNVYDEIVREYSTTIACYCVIDNSKKDGDWQAYATYKMDQLERTLDHQTVWVNFQNDEWKVRCTCRLFETNGWLCRHAFRTVEVHCYSTGRPVRKIPPTYILDRWTRTAKNSISLKKLSENEDHEMHSSYTDRVQQLGKIMTGFTAFCINDDLYDVMIKGTDQILRDMNHKLEQLKLNEVQDNWTGGNPIGNAAVEIPGVDNSDRIFLRRVDPFGNKKKRQKSLVEMYDAKTIKKRKEAESKEKKNKANERKQTPVKARKITTRAGKAKGKKN